VEGILIVGFRDSWYVDTRGIHSLLDSSHSTLDLLSGPGFAVLVLMFVLGTILPSRGGGGGGAMINMPSRFNPRLAFSVRVYTTTHGNCLGWLGERAGFGRQALGR
jgi:hypothetical protein